MLYFVSFLCAQIQELLWNILQDNFHLVEGEGAIPVLGKYRFPPAALTHPSHTHTHTQIHTHTYIHTYTHTHNLTHIHTLTHINTHMHLYFGALLLYLNLQQPVYFTVLKSYSKRTYSYMYSYPVSATAVSKDVLADTHTTRNILLAETYRCSLIYAEASVNWDLMEQLFLWQIVNSHGTFDVDCVVPLLPKLNFRGNSLDCI